jgi:hypothetical protein
MTSDRELLVIDELRARRFYDRLRSATLDWAYRQAGPVGQSLAGVLLFIPDVFMLLFRLVQRPEAKKCGRLLLGFAPATYLVEKPPGFSPSGLVSPLT